MIREDPLLFEGARWAHVSIAAKDFIACLLQKQPGRRLPPHAHAHAHAHAHTHVDMPFGRHHYCLLWQAPLRT